jgi:ankyrin repeat protein
MRVGNFSVFKFLLNKGVGVLNMNNNGMTAVHYAIKFERLEYLFYLFEGDQADMNIDIT